MLLGGKPLGSELLRMAVLVAATSKLCIPGTWQARSGGVELDEQVAKHLSTAYGDLASDVVALSVGERLCVRLDKRHPVLEGEVVWAVRYEMCRTAADFLARRCRLAFLDVQAAQRVRALNQTDLARACCGCSACERFAKVPLLPRRRLQGWWTCSRGSWAGTERGDDESSKKFLHSSIPSQRRCDAV